MHSQNKEFCLLQYFGESDILNICIIKEITDLKVTSFQHF